MNPYLVPCGKCGNADPIDQDNVWCKMNHEAKDVEDTCVHGVPMYALKREKK